MAESADNINVQYEPKLDARLLVYKRVVDSIGIDPKIERILPAENFNLPEFSKIDCSRFSNGVLKTPQIRKLIGVLYRIVNLPYVVDKFDDSGERDSWRLSLDNEKFNIVLQNALRPLIFTGARNTISTLQTMGGVGNDTKWGLKFHSMTDEILKATDDLDFYRELDKQGQVEFAKSFKSSLADLIKHIETTDSKW